MGQYYRAVLCDAPKHGVCLDPWVYDNGAKLMEHSYFHNHFVGAACRELYKKPLHTWWVGDYATEDDIPARCKEFNPTLCAWQGYGNFVTSPYQAENNNEFCNAGFLVNLTTKEYLSLEATMSAQGNSGLAVHPLPLLTAVGNGRGGGDYRGSEASMKMVGIWAGDLLQIIADKPKGSDYIDISADICFAEI